MVPVLAEKAMKAVVLVPVFATKPRDGPRLVPDFFRGGKVLGNPELFSVGVIE